MIHSALLGVLVGGCAPTDGKPGPRPDDAETAAEGGDTADTDTAGADTADSADTDTATFAEPRDTRRLSADDASAFLLAYSDDGGRVYEAVFAGDLDGDGLPNIVTRMERTDGWSVHVFAAELPYLAYPGDSVMLDVSSVRAIWALAGRADLSGDGMPDLVVSAMNSAGGVMIAHGPLPTESGAFVADAAILSSGTENETHEVSAGDFDGDGYGDLAMTSYEDREDGENAVYLFDGPLVSDRLVSDASGARSSDLHMFIPDSAADDLDGDGYADLLVGSQSWRSETNQLGTVWLFRGPIAGTANMEAADATIIGAPDEYSIGYTAEAVGDSNGDGAGDILLGAANYSDAGVSLGGAAWLVSGAPSGTVELSDVTARLLGDRECGYAGNALASGDTNGDGLGDMIVGAPSFFDSSCGDDSYVSIVRGPVEDSLWLSGADVKIGFRGTSGQMYLDGGVDIDDDGRDDLLVGNGYEVALFKGL